MSRPQVTLRQGSILGIEQNNDYPTTVETFLGLPYALPPLGSLRFKPPVPVPSSTSTLDASIWTPRCPQKSFLVGAAPEPESEDCLYLNVFRQQGTATPTSKLPVAVYLHAGAFNRGSCKMHDSASMVGWSSEPFVLVSCNYRIGAFGFLPSSRSAKGGALNIGLKDQRMVLEWVQENIAAFGGDPKCVTLFGLSAGAHSVAHHMMNINEPHKLFHRAIIESGAATSRACHPFDAEVHEAQFEQFLDRLEVPSEKRDDGLFEYLRTLPGEKIACASISVFDAYNKSLRWAFQPCIDGDIISRRPIDAWHAGDWHKMPIMTGFSTNEGSMYVDKQMSTPGQFTSFFRGLLPKLTESDLDTIDRLFPDPSAGKGGIYLEDREGLGSQFKRVERAYATYAYSSPARHTAHFASNGQEAPVYLYHWANISSVQNGANHGDNMWYQFHDSKVAAVSPTQAELVGITNAYWCSFIVSGDPNKVAGRWGGRTEWKPYRQEQPAKMLFGEGNDERAGGGNVGVVAQMVDDSWMDEQKQFWWSKTPSE